MPTRRLCQLGAHLRMLVAGVVVGDAVHIQFAVHSLVDGAKEGKRLLMTMSGAVRPSSV